MQARSEVEQRKEERDLSNQLSATQRDVSLYLEMMNYDTNVSLMNMFYYAKLPIQQINSFDSKATVNL